MKWTDDFQLKHMNMSYDKPVWVTLKIKSPKREDDPARYIKADYTFLHDWFGDQFRFVETEKTAPYDDTFFGILGHPFISDSSFTPGISISVIKSILQIDMFLTGSPFITISLQASK
mgnify:CR=1 FL=1